MKEQPIKTTIIATGGRIDEIDPRSIPRDVNVLYESQMHELAQKQGFKDSIEFTQMEKPKKGKNFDLEVRELTDRVVNAAGKKVIITMDTDQLPENSLKLAESLESYWLKWKTPESQRKVVIITGASEPLYKSNDTEGHKNMFRALAQNSFESGVHVIRQGEIFAPGERYKEAEVKSGWGAKIMSKIRKSPKSALLDTSTLTALQWESRLRQESIDKVNQGR